MDKNYLIRDATLSDVDGILCLLKRLSVVWEGPLLNEILKEMISSYQYSLIVCEHKETKEIAGTSTLTVQLNLSHKGQSVGHIDNVVTHSDHERKGIGAGMVETLKSKAKVLECYKVILDCTGGNTPFYIKCGFRILNEVNMRYDVG